jgi:hypothetical protein
MYVDAVTEYKQALNNTAMVPGTTIKATSYDVSTGYDLLVAALQRVKEAMNHGQ